MGPSARTALIGVVLGIIYVIAAHLGFQAAFVSERISIAWAPTGIAQAPSFCGA